MKKIILVFMLISCVIFPSLAQETPIELVKKARVLVKDSVDLVKSRKDLIQETKALIRDVQGLSKTKKATRFLNQNAKFQMGLTFQTFNFYNYNILETGNFPHFTEPQNFNNFAVGLSFRKKLAKQFSLKSELTYASQSEKFIYSNRLITDAQGKYHFIYNTTTKIKYGQIKIPILIEYKLNLGTKSTWSLQLYLGTQIAFLTSFKHISKIYHYPYSPDFFYGDFNINSADLEILTVNDSGARYRTVWNYLNIPNTLDPEGTSYYPNKYYPFRRFLFGLVGGMEVEKKLSPNLALGFGFRYEYNLSKTEKEGYEAQIGRSYSNQQRIGMTFSILKTIH